MPDLPPLRLTGAEILYENGLHRDAISIAGGRIATSGGREIDL